MLNVGQTVHFSASDLVGHLNCRYLTGLDLAVAKGVLAKPFIWDDPVLEVLAERGALHEQGYVDYLEASGLAVTTIDGVGVDTSSVAQTLEAMKAGAQIIVQGALQAAHWSGRADVLWRVEKPSHLGSWSYEVVDAKLARETKGSTVLQVCLYSELVAGAQKRIPEFAYVVKPGSNFQPEEFRIADYGAYYRRVKGSLERAVTSEADIESYPDPNSHCDVCRWRLHCEEKRRRDDHLCLVAGISKSQMGELKRQGITTTTNLAAVPLPLPWKPDRGAVQSYEKVREQARIQTEGRAKGRVVHEALPVVPGFGLAYLPQPSPGDVFLDLEGDPFVDEGGLEYLFGFAYTKEDATVRYRGEWALNRAEERQAFERFVDFVIARWERYPDLHVYHYAPYEPAALKRLMGRYVTRED